VPYQVQRLRAPDTGLCSFTVVDGRGLPVWPAEQLLAHLVAVGKASNIVEAYARDLRDLRLGFPRAEPGAGGRVLHLAASAEARPAVGGAYAAGHTIGGGTNTLVRKPRPP
jgi:hypothetical protein